MAIGSISEYYYSYNNQLRPKIDKDDDATWSKDELQNYADAYKKATGSALDVNALMEKYANEDGVIDSAAQEKMRSDDALGLSKLSGKSSSTSSSSSSSSTSSSGKTTGTTMSLDQKIAIYDAVNAFSYEYKGKFKPLLDKNDDGMWSKNELAGYATAYEKATGDKLDVDALMEKYGNEDGFIDPTNQQKIIDADALGLSALKTAYDNAKAATTETKTNKSSTEAPYGTKSKSTNHSMEDLMATMSSSNKMFFSVGINKLDSMGSMLNAFNQTTGSTNNMFSAILSDLTTLNQYKTSGAYSAMSDQAMNFTL